MKLLHTGDWHLGKIVNDYSMLEDQAFVLDNLLSIVEEEKPDVVIISGDIYDRSIPPKEAVELLDGTLNRLLLDQGIPVLMISGNHDGQERLEFGKHQFAKANLFIESKAKEGVQKVTLHDAYGPIHFFLLPYINPTYARIYYEAESIIDHDSLIQYFIDGLDVKWEERNVFVNHNFIASGIDQVYESDSERQLSIGGAEIVDVERLKDFDYVALGHLHRPQSVKYDHIRYSGSLLKYSASEIDTTKGVYIVELKEKSNVTYHFRELVPRRDFVRIEGMLEELISKSFYSTINTNDYMQVVLTDTLELYDPLSQLRAIYPNIMQIERPNYMPHVLNEQQQKSVKNKTPLELYHDFYTYMTGEELEKGDEDEIKSILEEVMKRGDEG